MGLADWWGGGNARGDDGEARGASRGLLAFLRRFGGWPGPALANKSAVAAKLAAEKANAGPPGIFLPRFLPYLDETTGETAQHRHAYRHMLADPNVKSALLGKILGVGRLTLNVKPADKGDPNDQEVARFVEWVLTRRLEGGIPGLAWSVLSGGLVDGYSVCEKVFARETFGRHAGKWPLARLKPIMTGEDVVLETDQHLNVVGILGLRYNGGKHFAPADFLIYRHLPMYNSPTGMSDLRAAYEPWWMLKNARWLRAQAVEKRAVGYLLGKWGDPSQQASLEDMLSRAKSHNWGTCPKDVEVELLDLAGSSDAIFDGFERSKKHDIFLAIRHAVLQNVEGNITDGRGNSQVHQSEAQVATLHLAATLEALINDRECGLVKDIVDLNYAVSDYPHAILSAVDVNELKGQVEVDKALLDAGLDLSKEELYERYDRTPPESKEDTLKKAAPAPGPGFPPGAPPGKGGPGFPPGGVQPPGGDEGGPPRSPKDEGEAEPFAEGHYDPNEARDAGGKWTGDGGGGGAAKPAGRPRYLYQQGEKIAMAHHRNMIAILKGLRNGDYDPDDAAEDAHIYEGRAQDASRTAHAARFRKLRDRVAAAHGAAAVESPEWHAVRDAFRKGRERAAGLIEQSADAVETLAHYYRDAAARGETPRISVDDFNAVAGPHDELVKSFHKNVHEVADAMDALRAKFPAAAKHSECWPDSFAEWDGSKHPRGHEGNAGQFARGSFGRPAPGGGTMRDFYRRVNGAAEDRPGAAHFRHPHRLAVEGRLAELAALGGDRLFLPRAGATLLAGPHHDVQVSPAGPGGVAVSSPTAHGPDPADPASFTVTAQTPPEELEYRLRKALGLEVAGADAARYKAQDRAGRQARRAAGGKKRKPRAAYEPERAEPAAAAPGAPPPEHLAAVARAFAGHPGAKGNLVPLHGLHKGSGLALPQLHAAVNHLRRQGVLSGVGAEGRHGVTGEERAAMIPEEGGHAIGHVAAKDRAKLEALAGAHKHAEGDGHWVTIDGEHVFIKGPKPEGAPNKAEGTPEPEPQKSAGGKQPWEMTREELLHGPIPEKYARQGRRMYPDDAARAEQWARHDMSMAAQDHAEHVKEDYFGDSYNPGHPDVEEAMGELDRTSKRYQKLTDKLGDIDAEEIPDSHPVVRAMNRMVVQHILAKGKTVPPEVLADYPDLAPR